MRQDGSGKYNELEATVILGRAAALNGNTYNDDVENTPSDKGFEEPQEDSSNSGNTEEKNNSGNENRGKSGLEGNNPFKSFQDFFNEYKR